MYQNKIDINIGTDSSISYCVGRSGIFDIKGLHIWSIPDNGGPVCFDCISDKSGTVLNAGFTIDRESFFRLVEKFNQHLKEYNIEDLPLDVTAAGNMLSEIGRPLIELAKSKNQIFPDYTTQTVYDLLGEIQKVIMAKKNKSQ